MLPVGIAHPLKVVDNAKGLMATTEGDSEPEEFEGTLKGSSNKDSIQPKHHGNHGSSSKEDQSSDDNEKQNVSSSADTSDSSSSSCDEDEDGHIQQLIPPEALHKETCKRENKDKVLVEPNLVKPKPIMRSPYIGQSVSQSYGRSSEFVLLQ